MAMADVYYALDTSCDESLSCDTLARRPYDDRVRALVRDERDGSESSSSSLLSPRLVAHASVQCPPLKVVLIGEPSVGKTSIYNCARSAPSEQLPRPTIGVEFFSLVVPEYNVRLQLWDTASLEQYALRSEQSRDWLTRFRCRYALRSRRAH